MDSITLGYVIIGVLLFIACISIFSLIYKRKYGTGTNKETLISMNETSTKQEEKGNYGFSFLTTLAGIILLIIGLTTDVGSNTSFGGVVNLHRLHVKQTLYYFSGICFIVSSISYGVEKIATIIRSTTGAIIKDK